MPELHFLPHLWRDYFQNYFARIALFTPFVARLFSKLFCQKTICFCSRGCVKTQEMAARCKRSAATSPGQRPGKQVITSTRPARAKELLPRKNVFCVTFVAVASHKGL
ncbi:hypothetical protein [Sodaliphilus sp.]|uniref:hypothetical protein n=1 Tax=Sodaliphilus sp. TaxID=2815818 RepID=UPI00388FCAC1